MIRDLFVDPLLSPVLIVLGLGGLFLLFLVLEWRSKPRFLYLRLLALLLLCISVMAVVMRPYYFSSEREQAALLITDEFSVQALDSLRARYNLEILQLSPRLHPDARLISWHDLDVIQSRLVAVLGEGIPASQLHGRNDLSYFYKPADRPAGISNLHIPTLNVGMPGLISGSYHNATDSTRLYLLGPGGPEDSTRFSPGATTFSLRIKPKQSGQYTYQIEVRNGRSVVSERVPVRVLPDRKLSILLLQTHPTFETRYLKNYLADKGHSLVARYLVSQNTYRFEFANSIQQRVDRLSPSILENFDLVIASDGQIKTLTPSERSVLVQSVKDGLGLLILVHDAKSEIEKILFPISLTRVAQDTVPLNHFSWSVKLPATALPLRVKPTPDITSVWTDENGNAVSGYARNGLGKVGFQLLTNTYLLSLDGKTDEFATLWSPLLEGVARPAQQSFAIRLKSQAPYFMNRPLQVEVMTAGKKPELFFDGEFIPLREDGRIDDIWTTTIWANKPGWHNLATQDSTPFAFFVHEKGEWQTLDKINQTLENQAHHTTRISPQGKLTEVRKNVSPLVFLLTFLLASGFLWLSPKL